jgi:uncharacterized protein (TIGR00730 family)
MTTPPASPPSASPPPASPPPAERAPLAYRDDDFLDSDEGRPVRILSEYLQPLRAFRRQHVHDTIAFFGSARIAEDDEALGGYYAAARELARLVTEWSAGLESPARRYVVCTGGGPGIMEAANRGARDAGGRTIGLNIGLPHEQLPNPYITPELSLEFRYFFMRKLWFAHLARAVVAFPGGFGTLDELCELLTLRQTGKLDRPIMILLYGSKYWREILNFDALARHGMIAEQDVQALQFADTPAEAFKALRQGLRPSGAADPGPALAKSVTCEPSCGPADSQSPTPKEQS